MNRDALEEELSKAVAAFEAAKQTAIVDIRYQDGKLIISPKQPELHSQLSQIMQRSGLPVESLSFFRVGLREQGDGTNALPVGLLVYLA